MDVHVSASDKCSHRQECEDACCQDAADDCTQMTVHVFPAHGYVNGMGLLEDDFPNTLVSSRAMVAYSFPLQTGSCPLPCDVLVRVCTEGEHHQSPFSSKLRMPRSSRRQSLWRSWREADRSVNKRHTRAHVSMEVENPLCVKESSLPSNHAIHVTM